MLFLPSFVLVIMIKGYEFNISNPSDCIIVVWPPDFLLCLFKHLSISNSKQLTEKTELLGK